MPDYKHLMDLVDVPPGVVYTIRKGGGEVAVGVKSVSFAGGVEGIARRIIAIWLAMPEHYQKLGWHWYDDANAFANSLVCVYDITLWQASQVISVLSPQNPWNGAFRKDGTQFKDGNRLCALNVVKAWFDGGEEAVLALRGWGYAPDFLAKAILVLKGEELDWSTSPKTHRFALLIFDPKRLDIVVVDSHASRIALGNLGGKYHVVGKAAYAPLEQGYLLAATTLGIPAYVAQAGTWEFATEGNLY